MIFQFLFLLGSILLILGIAFHRINRLLTTGERHEELSPRETSSRVPPDQGPSNRSPVDEDGSTPGMGD